MSRLADIPLLGVPLVPVSPSAAKLAPEEPVLEDPVPARAYEQRNVDDTSVDWGVVVVLRRQASEEISAVLAAHVEQHRRPMSEQDRRMMGRSVIRSVVRSHAQRLSNEGLALWPVSLEQSYATAVESAVFGYGRLQPLFEIPTAENIEINGCDRVTVQFNDGQRKSYPAVADSDEELVEAIRFLGESARPSRPFDEVHPTMTLAIGDRFRLHAIGFGLAHRPSITIRQHTMTDANLAALVDTKMLPSELASLLDAAVKGRKSIVIAGDQGAGKTTLLRALIAAIPATERFGTLETDYELLTHLLPGRENVVALQSRVGMGERVDGRQLGEVTVADLIPEALRQNLTRLIVGEVRGSEAGAMFQAMASGAGTLSTTHSHSAASTMDRLASRVAEGGVITIAEAYRQIAHHLHLLVHVTLIDDTWRGGQRRRFIDEVRYVTGGLEGDRPTTHLVYRADLAGNMSLYDPPVELITELAAYREVR
ncbi:MAG: CpaF family protein [Propionibacteriaceae bacterium]